MNFQCPLTTCLHHGNIHTVSGQGQVGPPSEIILMLKITGIDFSILISPGVYSWRRGNNYLYIGKSYKLIHRILNHDIIGVVEDLLPDDIIEFLPLGRDEIEVAEKQLIRKYNPKYNKYFNQNLESKENKISTRNALQIANSDVINESILNQKLRREKQLAKEMGISVEQLQLMGQAARQLEK